MEVTPALGGERQYVPIVTHGPFVAENRADLQRLSRAYNQGQLRISEIARRRRLANRTERLKDSFAKSRSTN